VTRRDGSRCASIGALVWLSGCSAQTTVDLLPLRPDAAASAVNVTDPDAAAVNPLGGADAAGDGATPARNPVGATRAGPLPFACQGAFDGGPTIDALYFGGANAYVEIPYSTSLDLGGAFAIEAWVYLCSAAGSSIVSQYVLPGEDKLLGIDPINHVPAAEFSLAIDEGMATVASSTPLSLSSWHHVAVSAGSGSIRLFIDGQAAATSALVFPIANASSPLFIGTSLRIVSTPSIDGCIADVRISSYDRYPTAFPPAPTLAADSATQALWPLDEGTGLVAADEGSNHLTGSIAASAAWVRAPAR
jgi:hypothetical protein